MKIRDGYLGFSKSGVLVAVVASHPVAAAIGGLVCAAVGGLLGYYGSGRATAYVMAGLLAMVGACGGAMLSASAAETGPA